MRNQRVRASGELRRSQLLLGTGPGAVLDLVEDAVVIAGLDAWRYGSDTGDGRDGWGIDTVVVTN